MRRVLAEALGLDLIVMRAINRHEEAEPLRRRLKKSYVAQSLRVRVKVMVSLRLRVRPKAKAKAKVKAKG